jgi:hypothetical protein
MHFDEFSLTSYTFYRVVETVFVDTQVTFFL